ncbi:MAG: hypothetical protein ACT4PV_13520 [Planctomycetaceae bacterium]
MRAGSSLRSRLRREEKTGGGGCVAEPGTDSPVPKGLRRAMGTPDLLSSPGVSLA